MAKPTPSAQTLKARRRELRLATNRDAFLDAAEHLFSRQGFHATTLKEIADQAEFSVPTIYALFDGKEDIFRQVMMRGTAMYMDAMRDGADQSESPQGEIHRLFDISVELYRSHPDFARLLLTNWSPASLSSELAVDTMIEPAFREALDHLEATFRRGQELGLFRAGDPVALARLYIGVCTTYHGLDPAIMTGNPDAKPQLPMADFHEMLDGMFGLASIPHESGRVDAFGGSSGGVRPR